MKRKRLPKVSKGVFCFIGGPEGSRTPNLLIRSQMLYPIKLQDPLKRNANIVIFGNLQT